LLSPLAPTQQHTVPSLSALAKASLSLLTTGQDTLVSMPTDNT
jgi:hypothetical protein